MNLALVKQIRPDMQTWEWRIIAVNKAYKIQFLFSNFQAHYWNAALVNQNHKTELNQNSIGKIWLDDIILLIQIQEKYQQEK